MKTPGIGMKQFKVKIVKATASVFWYANKIGEEYTVINCRDSENDYQVILDGKPSMYLLYKEDCVSADSPFSDIFGVPISIGDEVAFNPPKYKGLIIGRVDGFTPKKVRIEYKTSYSTELTTVYPKDLAIK